MINDYTDEELIKILKKEIKKLGKTARTYFNENKSSNTPSTSQFIKRFDKTWTEILEMLGLESKKCHITKEKILKDMARVYTEEGKLSSYNYPIFGKYATSSVRKNFGTFNAAKKALGIEQLELTETKESNEELLQLYIDFSKKIGKIKHGASTSDLNKSKEIYCSTVFIMRFGSIRELKEKAGFFLTKSRQKYTKEEIEKMLINVYKKNGRRLSISELRKTELPCSLTICSYYHTTKISEVWKEVELRLNCIETPI